MWFPLAMVLRSGKELRYNVLSMVWLNLWNFIRKVCNWPKILVSSIKIQCFWALFFNRYRFDSNCCFTNIITSLHSISVTRFLEFRKVQMITWQELIAELLLLLQWRYDSLNANQCRRQQAYVLWRTFQPRIPLAPFLSECYCSDLQCGGDDEDCGFFLLPGKMHRQ